MGRQYDEALIGAISSRSFITEKRGLEVQIRPVPDDEREHVLDPRILEVSRKKMRNVSMSPSWTSLIGLRHRPDKPTYRLLDGEVQRDEILMEAADRYIDLFVWTPPNHKEASPALVYLHGGAFMAGNVLQFEHQLEFIAEKSGAVVVYPEYRLAPETAFPGQIEDCVLALDYVREHAADLGIDPHKIMVAGDSAGGSLTNACVQLRGAGAVAHAFEIYPEVDLAGEQGEGYEDFPAIADQEDVARFRIDHLRDSDGPMVELCAHGKMSPHDPLISALMLEDCTDFSPVTIVTSEYDPLRIPDEKWATKLRSSGIDVEVIEYAGCDHGFFDHFGVYPQSEDVCLLMAEKLKEMAAQ